MNPNDNTDHQGHLIPQSGSLEEHILNVWREFVEKAGFQKINVIAHSAGGICLQSVQKQFERTFYK